MIKTAILDDQQIVLIGIRHMLDRHPNVVLTGIYQDRQSMLDGFTREMPDVLLLDISIQGEEDGDTIAAYLTKNYPDLRILALTNHEAPHYIKKMLRNGVHGYLLKHTNREKLVTAIETVYEGGQYLEPEVKKQLLEEFMPGKRAPKIPALTKREREILDMIVKQYSSQEIAEKLYLSPRTVENHRYNLCQKLEVKNVAGLISKCYELGLIH